MHEAPLPDELSRLRELTIRDDLTGLYNRRHFAARLAQIKEETDREGSHFALMMIDLDNFKRINDNRGHLTGDEVLRRVGCLLRESFRESDVPCRYAGDEFTVILPDTDASGAMSAAHGLIARVHADSLLSAENATLSIGVVTYPSIGGSTEEVFEAADRGLYRAKRAGKDAAYLITAEDVAAGQESHGLSEHAEPTFEAVQSRLFADPVTGLYNRVYFQRRLEEDLATALAAGNQLSVLLVGLPGLTAVNEQEGVGAGDRLLRRMAAIMAGLFQNTDTLCVFSGDRLATIVLAGEAEASTVARELLRRVRDEAEASGQEPIRCAIGIASSPLSTRRPAHLLHLADVAVRRAQRYPLPICVASQLSGEVQEPSFDAFVGRETELAELQAAYDNMLAGRGYPVLLVGDMGMGKTQLATELRHRIIDSAFFLTGRFYESGATSPYEPFREGLAGLLSYWREKEPRNIETTFGHLANRVREEFCDGAFRTDVQQHHTFEFFREVYAHLASVRPVVVFLDDLQWADAGSLELLAHLIRTTEQLRVGFLATARRQEVVDLDHPLRKWLRRLSRTSKMEQIELGPLSGAETREFIHASFGRIAVAEHTLERLYQESKGHPYFVAEILRLLVEDGRIFFSGGAWHIDDLKDVALPSTIVDVVELQLERLHADELDLFSQASVLGQSFTFGLLQALSEYDEELILDAMERGLRLSIIREEPDADDDRYGFYHSTVQRVLYERLSRRRRRALHRRAAELLESRGRGAAELAYHYVRGEEYARALPYTVEAGFAATAAYATSEALRFYRWALDAEQALDARGEAAEAVLGREGLLMFHLDYGRLLLSCGLTEEALTQLLTTRDRAEAFGFRLIVARAATTLAELERGQGDFEAAIRNARAALDACSFDEGAAAEKNRAAAHLELGMVHWTQGAMPAALEEFREAMAAARTCSDRILEGNALRGLALVHHRRGNLAEAQRAVMRALVIARETGDRLGEGRALNTLANITLKRGEPQKGLAYFQQALKAVREAGSRPDEAKVLNNIGEVYREEGRYDDALDAYHQSLVVCREIGDRHGEGIRLLNIGQSHIGLKHYDEALARLNESLAIQRDINDNDSIAETLLGIAEILIRHNRCEEALDRAGEALEAIRANEEMPLEWQALYAMGRCLVALGRLAEARAALSNAVTVVESLEAKLPAGSDTAAFRKDKQPLFDTVRALDKIIEKVGSAGWPAQRSGSVTDA